MLARIRACRLAARPHFAPRLFSWVAVALLLASPVAGQQRDARIPDAGDLWLEIGPELANWTEQFARNSADVGDGSREPLFAHFDGPIDRRLYPSSALFVDDLNRDAEALGFDPLTEDDFSMGDLDYQRINKQARRLAAGFEVGVYKRIAIGIRAPLTFSDVEPAFVFDTLAATVMGSLTAFPPGDSFFEDARTSMSSLDALITGGTLMGAALDDAIQLRAETDAYLTALELRAGGELLVPTGLSTAGTQMRERYANFIGGFEGLGLSLPGLTLPDFASAGDLVGFFENAPVSAMVPAPTSAGLALGEFEVSARFGLIDQITPRFATDTAAAATEGAGAAAQDSAGVQDSAAALPRQRERPSVRLRTTVGALVRIPRGTNGAPPLEDPGNFMLLPVADGQTDVELSLYQDVAFGDWLILRALGRYGIQMADVLNLRVHAPDRPYAFASTEATVNRDLGDYVQLVLRPSIRFNSAIWVGLEYEYASLGNARFTLASEPTADVPDATPLELESGGSRHMAGIGITYDLSEARSRQDVIEDRSPVRSPWQFNISFRRAVAGSGGRMPAPFRYAASFRIPIGIF